ncbi:MULTISPECIES: hypothetical protein [unclassified Chryseobacterium]|uniref:hypothetical protein n=1 Tax=unclassified Chryseobacterium TaxID=2593645 RepID=UPI000D3B7585|nr:MULTISPECIES: hypothetical protein [unclassified Chryseobacterium]PTT76560.1 hypothetical protein DBR25_05605 [Chryseobacterium sp. HMWF001]PVV55555.1 hypothetical protein DD829_13880 [Chryseobacterium sp. HMWF035]
MRLPFIIFFLFLDVFAYAQGLKDPLIKYYEDVSSYQEIDKLKKEIIQTRTIKEKGKLYWYIGLNYNNLNHEDSALSYYLKAKDILRISRKRMICCLKFISLFPLRKNIKHMGGYF